MAFRAGDAPVPMSLAAWQRDKEKGPEAEIRGAERGRRAVAAHGRAPSLPLRVCAGRAAGPFLIELSY